MKSKNIEKELTEIMQQAMAFHNIGEVGKAKILYQRALKIQPNNPNILVLLGNAECQIGNMGEGVKYWDRSLGIFPVQPLVLFNRGVVLKNLGKLDEALASYDKAIKLTPEYADAHYNRASVLRDLDRYDESIDSLRKVLTLKPYFVDAHMNIGFANAKIFRYKEAIESYRAVLSLKPRYAEAYYNLALVLLKCQQLDEAFKNFDQCLASDPAFAKGYFDKGVLLARLQRYEEALVCFNKTFEIDSKYENIIGEIIHVKMHLSDWSDFKTNIDKISLGIENGDSVSTPFPVLSVVDSPRLHCKVAEIYSSINLTPRKNVTPGVFSKKRAERIKIGYFSSDFRNHPVTHLVASLFEQHDKEKFEIYAFSHGPDCDDAWRRRVVHSANQFFDIRSRTDHEVAVLARDLGIDVAIDLNGFTGEARAGIFVERSAPVQASYVGYLGTMGAACMDYLFADKILIPPDSKKYYKEKIVYLPCYQSNSEDMNISQKIFSRRSAGLPDAGFIFCSFNNNYKIVPDVFSVWMRILENVCGSVLWLYVKNESAKKNLRNAARRHGIDGERIIFAETLPLDEHLARQGLADLFLDTHPYNAGATASNALRVGLPVLTYTGNSFPSRLGTSLVNCIDMPELSVSSMEDYEKLAIELGNCPDIMSVLKAKLANNLKHSVLFDAKKFARNMESAYEIMWSRYLNGMESDHIFI